MTVEYRGEPHEVRLSPRDYIAIVGIVVAIIGSLVSFAFKQEAERARSDEKIRALEARIVDLKEQVTQIRLDVRAIVEDIRK